MIISAQDGGGLTALVNARVNISVVAGLVAPPVFEQTQYYFTVSEDVLRGTVVGIVQASIKTGRVHNKHMPLFMLFLTLSLTAVMNSSVHLDHAAIPLVQISIGPLYTPLK